MVLSLGGFAIPAWFLLVSRDCVGNSDLLIGTAMSRQLPLDVCRSLVSHAKRHVASSMRAWVGHVSEGGWTAMMLLSSQFTFYLVINIAPWAPVGDSTNQTRLK